MSVGRFRYHFLPDREGRPGSRPPPEPPAEGLFRPHEPCPFDGPGFVCDRELARACRGDRVYHLTYNRYPVTPQHFLGVRPADSAPGALRQHVHGPEEIEDMAACARTVGRRFRVYFNSSRGADGSQSGSSVHHWHFQFFAYPEESPLERQLPPPPTGGSAPDVAGEDRVLTRVHPDWPAHHLILESTDDAALGRAVWRGIERIHQRNAAYNLELRELPGGAMRALLFPRRFASAREVTGLGRLSANFGGWEMSGDIVIPARAILDWVLREPEEAERLTGERLRETTCPIS